MPQNTLYLAVLPLIRVPPISYAPRNIFSTSPNVVFTSTGEQFLTLFPDKNFASEFYPEEVDFYLQLFLRSTTSLIGGHVVDYQLFPEPTADGARRIVRVVQNVA